MQYGHACSMDMGMQHGHGHAARTWACSTDMGMQYGHKVGLQHGPGTGSMDRDTKPGHGHGHGQDVYIDFYWTNVDNRELIF
jgi:hypothetical protein